ncbi:MAG: type II toxin-antitoxin system VapC family toxin [Verrucomicrobiales bacterium]|nr:type II toxin-antitoxin system VapC family toxin [Verrucomicrobiales bacterium]
MILDTNALSAWAEGNPTCRPAFVEASRLVIPVIVLGEYQYGIRQSRHRARYEEWLARNLLHAEIHPLGPATASHYADLRLYLKSQGSPIPANDLWIAALTVELQLPLLSNDRHFDLIPGLNRLSF